MVPKSVTVTNYHNTKINQNAHPCYIICEQGTAYLYLFQKQSVFHPK